MWTMNTVQKQKFNCKLLCPILKAAREMEEYKGKCKLEGDVLMLKGKRYSIETIRNLPANVNGFSVSCKAGDNIVHFWRVTPI